MGLSNPSLLALKVFSPKSVKDSTLEFFEMLKFNTKDLRSLSIIEKDELLELYLKLGKKKIKNNTKLKKEFNDFTKKLDSILFVKDNTDDLTEMNWKKIDEFCELLRLVERSDERKVRWALYRLFISGKQKISLKDISSELEGAKISNISPMLKKILRSEKKSGLDAAFDGKTFVINHFAGDKLVSHYLADAIEEPSRRSRGELEDTILALIDEGSYSNLEISKTLTVDETMVSKSMHRLKDKNKIVLSSFGKRGTRYFTTNCDNCPFGTTKDSCRKEALSYIITSFKEDFGIDLTANDFDDVESNQALLKMKRIIMNARKEKTTKMEQNLGENLSKFLGRVIDDSLEVKIPYKKSVKIPQIEMKITPKMVNLPLLYQLGISKGAKSGIQLVDRILKHAMASVKKEDRLRIRKHANEEINKFLDNIGINQ